MDESPLPFVVNLKKTYDYVEPGKARNTIHGSHNREVASTKDNVHYKWWLEEMVGSHVWPLFFVGRANGSEKTEDWHGTPMLMFNFKKMRGWIRKHVWIGPTTPLKIC